MSARHATALVLAATTLSLLCPSPVRSTPSVRHASCTACLESKDHVANKNPCATDADENVVSYECKPDLGNPEFYTEEACEKVCDQYRKCYCDGQCSVCASNDADPFGFAACKLPIWMFGDKCSKIPFVAPA